MCLTGKNADCGCRDFVSRLVWFVSKISENYLQSRQSGWTSGYVILSSSSGIWSFFCGREIQERRLDSRHICFAKKKKKKRDSPAVSGKTPAWEKLELHTSRVCLVSWKRYSCGSFVPPSVYQPSLLAVIWKELGQCLRWAGHMVPRARMSFQYVVSHSGTALETHPEWQVLGSSVPCVRMICFSGIACSGDQRAFGLVKELSAMSCSARREGC